MKRQEPEADVSAVVQRLRDAAQEYLSVRARSALLADHVDALLRKLVHNQNSANFDATEFNLGAPKPVNCVPFQAQHLSIYPNADGSSMIRIDDEKPFRAPRGLTDFLVHLASGGVDADGLVLWKSRASLLEWLRNYSGRQVDQSYVNKRVNDLRRLLRDAGIKRHLVHTDDIKGVRFALRRPVKGDAVR